MEDTYEAALARMDSLNENVDLASRAFKAAYPRDPAWPMGLAPDEIRFSPRYRAFKQNYEGAARLAREYASWFCKRYKKEYRKTLEERRIRRFKSA